MYLREMGTVPLLTRDGEVEIAKRIERGQLTVLKVAVAFAGHRSRNHLPRRTAEERSEHHQGPSSVQRRGTDRREDRREAQETLDHHRRDRQDLQESPPASSQSSTTLPKVQESRSTGAPRWNLGRTRVQLSQLVRSLEFSNSEKLRLMGLMKATVEKMRPLRAGTEQARTQSRPHQEGIPQDDSERHPHRKDEDRRDRRGNQIHGS